MNRLAPRRGGYTLLEVMLASAIAFLMMAALYTAMDVQLKQMEEGRNRIDRTTIARGLFNRIASDLAPSLAPVAPVISSSSTAMSSTGDGSTPATEEPATNSASTAPIQFHIGVKGDSSHVAIFQTRLNRSVISPPDDGTGSPEHGGSDIRRISYFLSGTGDGGLARQEIRWVTSDQIDDVPLEGDDTTRIIAQEVQGFSVRYFDGTSWTDSWDGSEMGPDGATAKGPPRAIEISVSLRVEGFENLKTFRHVVAFPAAPGAASESTTP